MRDAGFDGEVGWVRGRGQLAENENRQELEEKDHGQDDDDGFPDAAGAAVFDGELLVDPGELLRDAVRVGVAVELGAEQLRDGHLQDVGAPDEGVRVGDGQAPFT